MLPWKLLKNQSPYLGETPKRHIWGSLLTCVPSLVKLSWIIWEICSGQTAYTGLSLSVVSMETAKKRKFIFGRNLQKAHLGIMVDICCKFGEAGMNIMGDTLRTKSHILSHVSMETGKNKIHIGV